MVEKKTWEKVLLIMNSLLFTSLYLGFQNQFAIASNLVKEQQPRLHFFCLIKPHTSMLWLYKNIFLASVYNYSYSPCNNMNTAVSMSKWYGSKDTYSFNIYLFSYSLFFCWGLDQGKHVELIGLIITLRQIFRECMFALITVKLFAFYLKKIFRMIALSGRRKIKPL